MVILYHIGGEQLSMIFQVVYEGHAKLNGSKSQRFCVLISARAYF